MSHSIPLSSAVDFIRGITFKPEDIINPSDDDAVVCLRTKNIQHELDTSDVIAVPGRLIRRGELLLKPGDLLISSANSWNLVGKTVYVGQLTYSATAGGFIAIVRPRPSIVNGRYLYHWIMYPKTQEAIRNCSRQTTNISNLSVERFLGLKLPLHDLSSQRRIAALLDKADAIRKKRREAVKRADEFLRSVFFDMFGDPVRNPNRWKVSTLGERIEFITSGSRGWAAHYATEGGKFLRIQNVGRNRLLLDDIAFVAAPNTVEAKRTRVQSGDLLISITADLGRTAVVPADFGEGYINQHLALLRLRDIEPVFASAWLQSAHGQAQFKRLNRNGVKAGLNFDDLRSLQVALPPRTLQKKFVSVVGHLECLRTQQRSAKQETDDLFSSLTKKAFSGQL